MLLVPLLHLHPVPSKPLTPPHFGCAVLTTTPFVWNPTCLRLGRGTLSLLLSGSGNLPSRHSSRNPAAEYTEGILKNVSPHPPATKAHCLCYLHPQPLLSIVKYTISLGSKMSPSDIGSLLCDEVNLKWYPRLHFHEFLEGSTHKTSNKYKSLKNTAYSNNHLLGAENQTDTVEL